MVRVIEQNTHYTAIVFFASRRPFSRGMAFNHDFCTVSTAEVAINRTWNAVVDLRLVPQLLHPLTTHDGSEGAIHLHIIGL